MRSHATVVLPWLYEVLLVLFPRSFREEFGYEMMCDVRDACRRAAQSGGRFRLISLAARCVADVARNLVIQWVRTGLPALVVISASWTLLLFSLLALQGVPQASALFTRLHFAWLLIAIAMGLACIAFGRYHAKRWC